MITQPLKLNLNREFFFYLIGFYFILFYHFIYHWWF